MRILIEAAVHPTEDPDKVARAILNLFPDARGEDSGGARRNTALRYTASDISALAESVAKQRIRDAARAVLMRSLMAGSVRFRLNKQAALAGRANFAEASSPLGDLDVTVETEDPEAAVDAIAGVRP